MNARVVLHKVDGEAVRPYGAASSAGAFAGESSPDKITYAELCTHANFLGCEGAGYATNRAPTPRVLLANVRPCMARVLLRALHAPLHAGLALSYHDVTLSCHHVTPTRTRSH